MVTSQVSDSLYVRANEVKPGEFCTMYNGRQVFVKVLGDSQTFICLANEHNPESLPEGKMIRMQRELVVLIDNPFISRSA